MNNVQSPRTDEAAIEEEIRRKGLVAPRLTPALIDSCIKSAGYYQFPGTVTTVCCLTLENGFNVLGESAPASPDNFDAELGRKIAYADAREKIWKLEGYLLRHALHTSAMADQRKNDIGINNRESA